VTSLHIIYIYKALPATHRAPDGSNSVSLCYMYQSTGSSKEMMG